MSESDELRELGRVDRLLSEMAQSMASLSDGDADTDSEDEDPLYSNEWVYLADGPPEEVAPQVRHALVRLFGSIAASEVDSVRIVFPALRRFLRTFSILHVEHLPSVNPIQDISAVALLESKPLFSANELPQGSLLAALQVMDLETHGHGWHLHPIDRSGKHMRYKMMFDPERTQQEMSWERHSKGGAPWGDPATEVLSDGTARALHSASLAAVLKHSVVARPRERFTEWATCFETPGRTAFVAHPPVTSVTPWSS